MEIKFNLEDSEVFIPSGRLMNLKNKLGWSADKFNPTEINQALSPLFEQRFEVNLNADEIIARKLKNHKREDETYERERLYKFLTEKVLVEHKALNKWSASYIEELTETVQDLGQEVMQNTSIQKKLLKLKQLKVINE